MRSQAEKLHGRAGLNGHGGEAEAPGTDRVVLTVEVGWKPGVRLAQTHLLYAALDLQNSFPPSARLILRTQQSRCASPR